MDYFGRDGFEDLDEEIYLIIWKSTSQLATTQLA
jgi:hypothetical protein